MDNEFEFKQYTVTCKTEDCGNKDIAIPIDAPVVNPLFICGVCGQSITSVEAAQDDYGIKG